MSRGSFDSAVLLWAVRESWLIALSVSTAAINKTVGVKRDYLYIV